MRAAGRRSCRRWPGEGRAGDERRLAVALAIAEGERTGVAEGLPVLGAGVGVAAQATA